MALRLSTAEIASLEHANTVLLAPLSYENDQSWRRAAASALQKCLGGDASSFEVMMPGMPLIAAEPEVARVLKALDPPPDWVVRALTVTRRERCLTVTDWEELFDANKIRKSFFYNELVRPHGILAPVTMLTDTGQSPIPAALTVYFADEGLARRYVQRHKELARLLYPAYCAGLRTYLAYQQNTAALMSLAEDARIGVLVFDAGGHLERENAFFQQFMCCDPERDKVRAEVAHVIRGLLSHSLRGLGTWGTRRTATEFRSSVGHYRISATFLDQPSRDSLLAIALVEKIESRVDTRALADRFSLTQREIELALVMRNGLSTRQIAAELGISINTVRRHIERILLKLDVHTRTAAAAKLPTH
jgi:DNA-binding CsgD family transcriptional regulator